MNKFYITLWLRWVIRITFCSIGLASIASIIITLFVYLSQKSIANLDAEVLKALFDVFWFYFTLSWSLTLLIALFRSLKYIFNRCYAGHKLLLLSCDEKEVLRYIGYGDLVKVWRKWFMIIIWLVAPMMVISLGITYLVSDFTSIFEWFDIFWLFSFVLLSGYFSFILMISKCKRVELVKC